jgi:hypothetical protein
MSFSPPTTTESPYASPNFSHFFTLEPFVHSVTLPLSRNRGKGRPKALFSDEKYGRKSPFACSDFAIRPFSQCRKGSIATPSRCFRNAIKALSQCERGLIAKSRGQQEKQQNAKPAHSQRIRKIPQKSRFSAQNACLYLRSAFSQAKKHQKYRQIWFSKHPKC